MSLNDWAYTPEEQERLEEGQNLENRILIETEIDGTIQKLRAVDLQIDDLGRLAKRIEQLGGVDKTIAQEAMVIIPEFSERHKLNEFTTAPTSVKYKVSMEEISLSMALGIGSALAAVTALLYKFLNWLFGSSSRMSGGGGSISYKPGQGTQQIKENLENISEAVEETEKAARATLDVSEELQRILSRGLDLLHEDKVVTVRNVRDFAKIIDEPALVEMGLRSTRLVDLDLATNGPIAQFFVNNVTKISDSINHITASLELLTNLEKAVREVKKIASSSSDNEDRKYEIITEMIAMNADLSVMEKLVEISERVTPIVEGINKARADSESTYDVRSKINYFEFLRGYVSFGEKFVRHKLYTSLVNMYDYAVENAEEVYLRLGDLSESFNEIKEMPPEIFKDVSARLQAMISKTSKLQIDQTRIISFLNMVIGSYLDTIKHAARVNKSTQAKLEAKVVVDESNEESYRTFLDTVNRLYFLYNDFEHVENVYERNRAGDSALRTRSYDTMVEVYLEKARARGKKIKES